MSLDALAGLHVMTRRVVFDPIVKVRGEQPYVAVRDVVSLETVNEIADRLPEVFEWLGERGLEAVDAPFLRYRFIDMPGRLEVEVEADDGQQWGCRLEVFRTNPAEQPNPDEWGTELLFRLADDEPLPS